MTGSNDQYKADVSSIEQAGELLIEVYARFMWMDFDDDHDWQCDVASSKVEWEIEIFSREVRDIIDAANIIDPTGVNDVISHIKAMEKKIKDTKVIFKNCIRDRRERTRELIKQEIEFLKDSNLW